MLEVRPSLSAGELGVFRIALERAGLRLDGEPPAYRSPWRLAGLREAVESAPPPVAAARYTLSPRNTRGATRA
ncbi:MAG TPA: hypothetical protein VNJ46_01890 [Gaiellaceae bacterium]|nr:hypothetical protein [Gaiellaceae bacterium]